MKPVELKCPACGYKIGMLSIRRIRKIVRTLIKHIDRLPQLDRVKLEAELDRIELEAEAEERAMTLKIERERREYLDKLEENEESDRIEDLEDDA